MKLVRITLVAIGLLLSTIAVGQSGDGGDEAPGPREELESKAGELISNIATPENDLAMGWIEQIFGAVAFTAWSGEKDSTLLGKAIGFTNVVALILGVVIIAYVFVSAILRTAHEGEVMGKQWSTLWLPVRTALSFGLITPVAGGLSSIQVVVLSLIVIGSNAGSYLWKFAGEEISTGATIVSQTSVVGTGPVRDVFASLVCAQSVYLVQQNMGDDGEIAVARVRRADDYTLIHGPLRTTQFSIPDDASSISFGNGKFNCGSIEFGSYEKGLAGTLGIGNGENHKDYHWTAKKLGGMEARRQIEGLLNSLGPIAYALVTGVSEGGLGGAKELEALQASGENAIAEIHPGIVGSYAAVVQHFTTTFPMAIAESSANNEEVRRGWRDDVTKGGWGNAGTWFFDVTRFQALHTSIINDVLGSISRPSPPRFCGFVGRSLNWNSCQDYTETAAADMTEGVNLFHKAAIESLGEAKDLRSAAIKAMAELEKSQADSDVTSKDEGLGKLTSALWAQVLLQGTASVGDMSTDGLNGETSVTQESGMASPFRTVAAIGESINNVAIAAWTLGLTMHTAKEGMGVLSEVPIVGGAKGALAWMGMTVVAVLMALVPMGFILAFLVPFLPIIAWIRLIAAYLLTAIEAVVAAPLAVIMMATPEGEGIVGTRLERAIQMLAAVILKPTLLVIGLLASLTLAFVTFAILNQLFWTTAANVTGSVGPMEIMGILVIYVGAA